MNHFYSKLRRDEHVERFQNFTEFYRVFPFQFRFPVDDFRLSEKSSPFYSANER